jgi:ABC-type lipoprotein release transport system permease subunit
LFLFSIRNAFRGKWVPVIAIMGTGLGCALMAVLMSLSAGMEQRLDRTMLCPLMLASLEVRIGWSI